MAKNKIWNWQQDDWPEFQYNTDKLQKLEDDFLHSSGEFLGAYKHVSEAEQQSLIIDLMSDEALKTSEIEGEILNRDSVQASIRRQLGLSSDRRIEPFTEVTWQRFSGHFIKIYSFFFRTRLGLGIY